MIRLNREERRILEAKLRSDHEEDETWFFVNLDDHVGFPDPPENSVEIGTGCDDDGEPVDVTIEIGYEGLRALELGMHVDATTGSPVLLTHSGVGFGEYAWRWYPKRKGFYAEVAECDACGNVHIPVLTMKAVQDILRALREKGHLAP